MIVNNNVLNIALNTVQAGLSNDSAIIQEMTHFIFTGTHLVTYNNQIYVSIEYQTEKPFSVDAKKFKKFVSAIKEPEIDITVKEDKLIVKANKAKATFALIKTEESPIMDMIYEIEKQLEGCEFKDIPNDFFDAVSLCKFSVAKDDSLGSLTCIRVDNNVVFGGDNVRASRYTLSDSFKDVFMFKASNINSIPFKDLYFYCITDGFINFKGKNDLIYSIRKVNGTYPNYVPIFEHEDSSFIEIPVTVKDAINIASIMNEEDSHKKIRIDISENTMNITSKDITGMGEIETEACVKNDDNVKVSFFINSVMFGQVLSKNMLFSFNSGKLFLKNENFEHVLMALIDDEETNKPQEEETEE